MPPSLVDRFLGLPPARATRVRVDADLEVRMRDGALLRADRYVADGHEDAPVLLLRTPYGRKHLWRRLYCLPFARRGFQVVIQSCRGTEDSQGELVPFAERDDGADTVSWLREQPWYPGRFATFGPSYWGLAQWAVAEGAPYDLVAMVPQLTTSRFVRSLFFGGAFSLHGWLAWSAILAAQQDVGPGLRSILRARSRKVGVAARHLPLGEADRVATGRRLDWWQAWLAHPDADDPYWDQFDSASAVGTVRAPVAMVTSWQDLFAPWQLEDWIALPQDLEKRLVIAPWPHEHPEMVKLCMREALGWLAAQVLGEAPVETPAPVRYYVTGAEEWRHATTWPLATTVPQAWYLQPGGGLAVTAPADGQPSSYRFDPADPTPSLGGPPARRNARVRQVKLERRPDVLTFTSAPLDAPPGSHRNRRGNHLPPLQPRPHRRGRPVVRRGHQRPVGQRVRRHPACDTTHVPSGPRRGPNGPSHVVADGPPLRSRSPDPPPGRQRCLSTLRPQPRDRRRSGQRQAPGRSAPGGLPRPVTVELRHPACAAHSHCGLGYRPCLSRVPGSRQEQRSTEFRGCAMVLGQPPWRVVRCGRPAGRSCRPTRP